MGVRLQLERQKLRLGWRYYLQIWNKLGGSKLPITPPYSSNGEQHQEVFRWDAFVGYISWEINPVISYQVTTILVTRSTVKVYLGVTCPNLGKNRMILYQYHQAHSLHEVGYGFTLLARTRSWHLKQIGGRYLTIEGAAPRPRATSPHILAYTKRLSPLEKPTV